MMKLNNKGFMMAEVIIVSVMILTVLITMYTSYSKVLNYYKSTIDYYNIDGVYRLAYIRDVLMDNNNGSYGNSLNYFLNIYNNNIDTIKNINQQAKDIVEEFNSVPEGGTESEDIDDNSQYTIYFIKNSHLSTLSTIRPSMADYITYLSNSVSFTNDYLIILEWEKVDRTNKKTGNYYYSYLELEV